MDLHPTYYRYVIRLDMEKSQTRQQSLLTIGNYNARGGVHMRSFTFEALPGRVIFGSGVLSQLAEEIERLQKHRAMLIVSGSAARLVPTLTEQLADRLAGVFSEVAQHVPASLIEKGLAVAHEIGADCIVTLG